jgi:hypothetical protein
LGFLQDSAARSAFRIIELLHEKKDDQLHHDMGDGAHGDFLPKLEKYRLVAADIIKHFSRYHISLWEDLPDRLDRLYGTISRSLNPSNRDIQGLLKRFETKCDKMQQRWARSKCSQVIQVGCGFLIRKAEQSQDFELVNLALSSFQADFDQHSMSTPQVFPVALFGANPSRTSPARGCDGEHEAGHHIITALVNYTKAQSLIAAAKVTPTFCNIVKAVTAANLRVGATATCSSDAKSTIDCFWHLFERSLSSESLIAADYELLMTTNRIHLYDSVL